MRWMVYVGERGWPVVISTAEIEVLIGDRLAGNLGVVNSAWVGGGSSPTWWVQRKAAVAIGGLLQGEGLPLGRDGDL
jgi:hypothetical protein